MLRSDEARSFMKIPICSVLGKWGSKWPKKESFAVNQLKFFNWPLYQINLLIVLVINYWTKMLSANQILRILSFSWTKSEIWWVYRYRYVQICLILCKILRWFTRPTGLVLAISTMLSLCFDYSQPINFRILFLAISVEEIKRTILMIDIQRDKREQKGKRKNDFFSQLVRCGQAFSLSFRVNNILKKSTNIFFCTWLKCFDCMRPKVFYLVFIFSTPFSKCLPDLSLSYSLAVYCKCIFSIISKAAGDDLEQNSYFCFWSQIYEGSLLESFLPGIKDSQFDILPHKHIMLVRTLPNVTCGFNAKLSQSSLRTWNGSNPQTSPISVY